MFSCCVVSNDFCLKGFFYFAVVMAKHGEGGSAERTPLATKQRTQKKARWGGSLPDNLGDGEEKAPVVAQEEKSPSVEQNRAHESVEPINISGISENLQERMVAIAPLARRSIPRNSSAMLLDCAEKECP